MGRARNLDFFVHFKQDTRVRCREVGVAPTAIAVGEGDRSTRFQSQHARGMQALRLGQLAGLQIRNIEYKHR